MNDLCNQIENQQKLVVERQKFPHCNQNLSSKTFKAHERPSKRRYYDRVLTTHGWPKKKQLQDGFDSSDNESPPSICENNYESMEDDNNYLPPSSPLSKLADNSACLCYSIDANIYGYS